MSVTEEDVLARYVDRHPGAGSNPKELPPAVFDELRRLLRRNERVLLTGQKGAGKSTELRRLLVDPGVAERFERVTMVVSHWVDQGQSVDMRFVLLSLAAALAQHIAEFGEQRYRAVEGWESLAEKFIQAHGELLQELGGTSGQKQAGNFKGRFFEPFAQAHGELRGDEARRSQALAGARFAVPALRRLVVELLALIEAGALREILLIVDDGDKLAREDVAREVFVVHGEVWLRLPCRAVVTYPYWLHFDPAFRPISVQCETLLLENIKVIKAGAPAEVLPAAVEFFRRLLDNVLEDSARLVDGDALREAVLLGAGVPREFLRVLERGFMRAEQRGEETLTRDALLQAAQGLRVELIRMTQHEPVRRALVRVHLSQELRTQGDWRLLDQLMVIEHCNGRPWYDVHPLLAGEVDQLAAAYRARLKSGEAPVTDTLVLEYLDDRGR